MTIAVFIDGVPGSVASLLGSEKSTVSTFSVPKPGAVVRITSRPFRSSPAPASSTNASAVSATTSMFRTRQPPVPAVAVRLASRRLSLRSGDAAASAGTTPKRMPVASERASVNPRTQPSAWVFSIRGM